MPVVRSYVHQVPTAPLQAPQRGRVPTTQLQTPILNVSPGPEAFGAGAGANVAALGEHMFQQELQFRTAEKLKADRARLSSAENDLLTASTSYLFDPQQGVISTVRGRDAVALPSQALQNFDKWSANISAQLKTRELRDAFGELSMRHRLNFQTDIFKHADSEMQKADLADHSSKIGLLMLNAANQEDAQEIQKRIDDIDNEIIDFNHTHGIPESTTKEQSAKAHSSVWVGIIDRALARGSSEEAKVYFDFKQKELLPDERDRLIPKIATAVTDKNGLRLGDVISSGGGIGMVAPGNLDPYNRPILNNETGQVLPPGSDVSRIRNYSTTSSASFNAEDLGVAGKYGKEAEVLIPTVVNGKRLTEDEAKAHFRKTGEHLGVFDTWQHADVYAEQLHLRQARQIEGGSARPTLQEMMDQARQIDDSKLRKFVEGRIAETHGIWKQQEQDTNNANEASTWQAVAQGATLADIIKMPSYQDLPGDKQASIKEHVADRLNTLKQRARGDDDWLWTQQQRARTRAEQKEEDLTKAAYSKYLEISSPQVLVQLSEPELMNLIPVLGTTLTGKLIEKQRELAKSSDKVQAAQIDQDLFNVAAESAGLKPYATPSNRSDIENARLGALKSHVEDVIAHEQQARGRELARDEKSQIMQKAIDQKVVVGSSWWRSGTTVPAGAVLSGENAIVPQAQIPQTFTSGVTALAHRLNVEITPDALEHAYALALRDDSVGVLNALGLTAARAKDIPPAERAQVEAALKTYGKPVNDESVLRLYLLGQLRAVTATNPATGERRVYRNGQWMKP